MPSDVDYELIVLRAYKGLLDKFRLLNPQRFDARSEDQIIVDC